MTPEQMLDLKNGDQLIYTGKNGGLGGWPPTGTVVTRKKEWLDDQTSVMCTWLDIDGSTDYHFFRSHEIEFIKE
jgi:hypothetical protein